MAANRKTELEIPADSDRDMTVGEASEHSTKSSRTETKPQTITFAPFHICAEDLHINSFIKFEQGKFLVKSRNNEIPTMKRENSSLFYNDR